MSKELVIEICVIKKSSIGYYLSYRVKKSKGKIKTKHIIGGAETACCIFAEEVKHLFEEKFRNCFRWST